MRIWLKLAMSTGFAIGCTTSVWGRSGFKGYLAPGELDVTHILEPAPRPGGPRYKSDREIFRATRAMMGTPRWVMAASDAKSDTASLLRDYSCAVGVVLTPERAPALVRVLERASTDTLRETAQAKKFYHRHRPYTIDSGQICQSRSELYDIKDHRVSYDYPSGHTTLGWTYALILASLVPDHTQRILERGRSYGDSRFICGAHNESAVEAGILSATATMRAVASTHAYQADLAKAWIELTSLRASGTAPQNCAAEANLVRQRVMSSLKNGR